MLKSKSQQRQRAVAAAATTTTIPKSKSTPEDRAAWEKLFNYIDADRTGTIEKMELEEKMSKMIGKFEWTDQVCYLT